MEQDTIVGGYKKIEKEKLCSCFKMFDLNGDGRISKEELLSVFGAIGIKVTPEQIDDLMQDMDTNQDSGLDIDEFQALFKKMLAKSVRSGSEILKIHNMRVDSMAALRSQLANRTVYDPEKVFNNVVLIVVVAEEIQPVLDKYQPVLDEQLTKEFLNLAIAYTCMVGDSEHQYKLTVLRVGESKIYHRHNSGYSQSAAIAALAVKVLNPDIVVSFGTAGGIGVQIGDVILGTGTVFMDRFRTSSKNSFDWGVFGGTTMAIKNLPQDLGFKEGLLGSQSSYKVSEEQEELMETLGVVALDMEAAPEAQILEQTKTNFVALKAITNGIYPDDSAKMEQEYVLNKAFVSQKAMEALDAFFQYLVGKKIGDL